MAINFNSALKNYDVIGQVGALYLFVKGSSDDKKIVKIFKIIHNDIMNKFNFEFLSITMAQSENENMLSKLI